MKKLKTDYVDLLLIHQPFGDYYGTYRAMEEAYKAEKHVQSAFQTSIRIVISILHISQKLFLR